MIIQQTDVEQPRSLRSLVLRLVSDRRLTTKEIMKNPLHYTAKIDIAVLSIATIYLRNFQVNLV